MFLYAKDLEYRVALYIFEKYKKIIPSPTILKNGITLKRQKLDEQIRCLLKYFPYW
jgi:hypothetical protein